MNLVASVRSCGTWRLYAVAFPPIKVLTTLFPLKYNPIGQSGTSLGCRYTQQAFLKGAIRKARFTPRAITPAEFMPIN
jgi:hypothetical protein